MNKRPLARIVLGLLADTLLTVLVFGQAPQAKKPEGTENRKCLSCHAVDTLSASVHADLSCTDCHQITMKGRNRGRSLTRRKRYPAG